MVVFKCSKSTLKVVYKYIHKIHTNRNKDGPVITVTHLLGSHVKLTVLVCDVSCSKHEKKTSWECSCCQLPFVCTNRATLHQTLWLSPHLSLSVTCLWLYCLLCTDLREREHEETVKHGRAHSVQEEKNRWMNSCSHAVCCFTICSSSHTACFKTLPEKSHGLKKLLFSIRGMGYLFFFPTFEDIWLQFCSPRQLTTPDVPILDLPKHQFQAGLFLKRAVLTE